MEKIIPRLHHQYPHEKAAGERPFLQHIRHETTRRYSSTVNTSARQEAGASLPCRISNTFQLAVDFLRELPWKKEYAGALVGIAANWMMDDPETASDEIRNFKGMPAYDWTVAGLYSR